MELREFESGAEGFGKKRRGLAFSVDEEGLLRGNLATFIKSGLPMDSLESGSPGLVGRFR